MTFLTIALLEDRNKKHIFNDTDSVMLDAKIGKMDQNARFCN